MKGYEVRISGNKNFKAFSYQHFLNKRDAERYARSEKKRLAQILKRPQYYRIIENDNLDKCRCGRLFDKEEGTECLRCQDIRQDAMEGRFDETANEVDL